MSLSGTLLLVGQLHFARPEWQALAKESGVVNLKVRIFILRSNAVVNPCF